MQPKMETQYGRQILENLNNHPQQNAQLDLWEKFRKVESRTLGAVQVIIGLIHIGFGGVSTLLCNTYIHYAPLTTYGAYPFWGGLFFIVSGSLSVSADRHRNICLVQSSVGMNITSAVISLIGAILYISEMIINVLDLDYSLTESIGFALSILLLAFTLLEFCITVSTSHFGCQATCCTNDVTIVVVPYTVIGNDVISSEATPAEASLFPPAQDNMAFCPDEAILAEASLPSIAQDNISFCPDEATPAEASLPSTAQDHVVSYP
ncbi:membrane-spanning 4-domains subfamily A member 8-like isoform X2 [Paroedura picta]